MILFLERLDTHGCINPSKPQQMHGCIKLIGKHQEFGDNILLS